jgi:ankyrin repeat protein
MSNSKLPERASLEYLKKLAKDRLRELRQADPRAKLATAQVAVARDHGFSSWRALKAELEQRQTKSVALFFDACAKGDVAVLRGLLVNDPSLARISNEHSWTGLHAAAQPGHMEVVRLLLEYGADPNAREAGDHTYPLHWAAAHGHIEIARALLDADGDVHGIGDDHELDVIGWATVFRGPGDNWREVVSLLLQRGARHHIYSSIAVGDLDLIRKLVEQNPKTLDRRMSRFEQGQTPLHFAISRNRYDILDLLIELDADLEASDNNGHTVLAVAMLRGDREAMRRLHAAGAKQPPGWEIDWKRRRKKPIAQASLRASMARMADSIKKAVPMLNVPDVARALDWYTSIGFKELGRYEDDGAVNWGMVSFGRAELMLTMGGKPGPHDVNFWFYTDRIENLYQLLKSRQLEAAEAALAGEPGDHRGIEFVQDIYNPPYGGREFGIRDLNGYVLNFLQPSNLSFLQFAHDNTNR